MPGPDLDVLLAWGRSLGLDEPPSEVQLRPWATTVRVGRTWLKACGAGGRYEAALLGGLLWWGAPHAVLPLAVDVTEGYVALPDGGPLLRGAGLGAAPWPQLLAEHAALQRRLQRHADDAVALGVPDLRPEVLPARLAELLSRVRLDDHVRAAVEAAQPLLAERCALLAGGPVPVTVQHDDLHDGNLVVDARGATRVLDWGDSCVGHPFGVLLVTLRVLAHRYGLDDRGRARLRDAYLEAWTDLADRATLLALADAAQRVQAVGRALSWERALQDADDDERAQWDDPVAGWLAELAGQDSSSLG
jgi:hypothetical protein